MTRHTDTWKRAERRASHDIGGERLGNLGRAAPDAASSWAVVEVKTRKTLPKWQKDALRQAESAATLYTTPHMAIVRLHEVHGLYAEDMALIRWGDLVAWYGDPCRGRGDEESQP